MIKGSLDLNKRKIISIFNKNVKGKKPDTSSSNLKHDGKGGYWLEEQMGIKHNGKNAPDLFGFEMKNNTSSNKTSFGDWSANFYLYKDKTFSLSRSDFIKIFGKKNIKEEDRYSWSGEPIPKIDKFSNFGQILLIDDQENLIITYSFSKDLRQNKKNIIPINFQKDNLIIARWDNEKIKQKVEKKFNEFGWFKCEQNKDGVYTNIAFGDPITWEVWLDGVKKGLVFFDSGMYFDSKKPNNRPYSQWRASNKYWNEMVTSRY